MIRIRRMGVAGATVIMGLSCLSSLALPSSPVEAAALTALAKPHCPSAQFGAAVAISGTTAVIGAQGAPNGGAVCIFARSGKTWSLQASLSDPAHGKYDEFGTVVAVSTAATGTYVMVGALGDGGSNGNAQPDGPVYVFRRSGTAWYLTQRLQDPLGYHAGNWFGATLAMSGSSAVITAIGTGNFKGAVYAYTLSGRSWKLQAALKNPGISFFGGLASISGSTILIGDGGPTSPPGEVALASHRRATASAGYPDAYVYVRSGSSWHLQAHIGVRSNDDTQPSVAVDGNTAMLTGNFVADGSTGSNDWGRVYIFRRDGSTWRNIQVLSDPTLPDGPFSNSVSISGTTAVMGAPYDGCGIAYVYDWTGKKWALRVKMLPPGGGKCGANWDAFGWAVAVSGQTTIVGAPGTGQTYVLNIP